MERRSILVYLVVMTFLVLTGCSEIEQPADKEIGHLISANDLVESLPAYVVEKYEDKGKILSIDADIIAPDMEKVKEISLVFDESLFQAYVGQYIGTESTPVVEITGESGERIWEDVKNGVTRASVVLSDEGYVSYLNAEEDRNLPFFEEDGTHIFEYGYITDIIPPTLEESARNVADKVQGWLGDYSVMTFRPWNILAQGDLEKPDGCYIIELQGEYEKIPISVKCESTMQPISATVYYSADGVFGLKGNTFLSEKKTDIIDNFVSFQDILDRLYSDFSDYSLGECVIVDRIQIEYFPQLTEDNSILLIPVWCVSCEDIRIEEDRGTSREIRIKYQIMYNAEDGAFCGMYY